MAKGLDGGKNKGKMEGLDGRKELGSETILVFGPESVWYERSRPIDRCILREISARVFFGKNTKNQEKSYFQYFQDIRQMEKTNFQYFQDTRT